MPQFPPFGEWYHGGFSRVFDTYAHLGEPSQQFIHNYAPPCVHPLVVLTVKPNKNSPFFRPQQAPPPPTTDFAEVNHTPSMYNGQDMNQMPNGLLDPNAHHHQQPTYQSPPSMMTPMQPQQQFNAGPPPPQQQQQPPMTFQPMVPAAVAAMVPGQYQFQSQPPIQTFQPAVPVQHQQQPPKPQTPEPPKSKAPLPEEYVYMQTVFNELKLQCSNAASNPVSIKRKKKSKNSKLIIVFFF